NCYPHTRDLRSFPTRRSSDLSETLAEAALNKLHFDVAYFASTNIKEIELYSDSPIRVDVDWDLPQVTGARMSMNILSGEEFSFSDRKSTRLNSSHVKISYAVF